MLTLTCHCRHVRIETERRPDFIHECNCSFCAKAGVRWGYFQPAEVSVDGKTRVYCRSDKAEPSAEMRFCDTCGALTHFTLTPAAIARFGDSVIGVNMRLAHQRDLAGVELRYPDGRAWSGEGDFGYVRAARVLGQEGGPE